MQPYYTALSITNHIEAYEQLLLSCIIYRWIHKANRFANIKQLFLSDISAGSASLVFSHFTYPSTKFVWALMKIVLAAYSIHATHTNHGKSYEKFIASKSNSVGFCDQLVNENAIFYTRGAFKSTEIILKFATVINFRRFFLFPVDFLRCICEFVFIENPMKNQFPPNISRDEFFPHLILSLQPICSWLVTLNVG